MLSQFLLVLEVVAPVVAVAAVGLIWARVGAPFDIAFITRLSTNVSGPCLLFSTLATVDLEPSVFEAMAGAALVLHAVVAAASALLLWGVGLSQQAYLGPLTFANTGNVGLPVAYFAFGEQGLALALMVFALTALLTFTFGVWMAAGRGAASEALRQPIFYGAALGAVAGYFDLSPPDPLLEATALLGQLMIPLMLLTLGVSVARLRVRALAQAAGLSAAKAAIGVAAAILVARLVGLDAAAAGVLTLQAAMPVAVTAYLLAERYNAEAEAVSGLVVVSTALSLAVAPLTLALVLPGPDGVAPLERFSGIAAAG